MKRASKRLISAIIALVASVLLCIGVCLAWFAVNDNVSGNGLQTQVKGGDIVSFNVTAYYLDFKGDDKTNFIKAETGNKTINGTLEEFDKNSNGVFDISAGGNDEMRSYDPSKSYASAVLFEVSYEIKADSEKTFRIYASCSDTTEHFTVKNEFTVIKDSDPNNDIYYSSVSNSVFLSEAISEIGVYSYNSLVNKTFINGDYTKEFTKYLRTGITKENATGTLYYIMDYDEALFNTLTNKMLNSGGTLISTLSLDGDVIFGMEEYTSAESTVTVTFNMNGHGTQIDSVETVDGKISVPTEPTAVGYTFGGWYLNADCTGTAIDFDSYTFEDNTTLYAKWTEESSGGTVATYSASVSDGTLSTTSSGVFAWGGTTALDTDNMKFSSDEDTLTITLAYLEAGQQVEITLNCMDASSTKDIYFSIASSNATPESYNSSVLQETYTDVSAEPFTVSEDGTATFVITRGGGGTLKIKSATVVVKDSSSSGDTTPTVESVTVTAAGGATTVANGGTLQLTASVSGTNNPAQTVTWAIADGATATGATVGEDGLLSAGTVAGSVTIRATSTVDTSKYGEITITVEAASSGGGETGGTIPTYEEMLERADIVYSDDFSSYTDGYKLTELTDYNTAGVYSIPDSTQGYENSYTEVSDGRTHQVTNVGVADVSTNGANTVTALAFGDVSSASVVEGYFEITTTAVGSKWDLISFVNSSDTAFAVRIDTSAANPLTYTVNGGSAVTPSQTFVWAKDITYKVYFKIDVTNGTITVNITDGTNVYNVSNVSIGSNAINGIKLTSGNKGQRYTSIDNLVICAS